ncbi:lantibiotic dehydratase C-terminal domain-containing protein [uncultured Proteiniphilum sp.]|uniref:lantibiotic dehydratase C-terminal domain-containing protein n=1 Tax=uncultured Proteiniphilum sp. TaxID=497637 RepID=UPI00345040CA
MSKPYIDNILSKNNDSEIYRLVSSYIHLCCNRTFDYDFRKGEYIVYDIIYRYLKIQIFSRK